MVLLISYDLHGDQSPERYAAIGDFISNAATSSVRALLSQWLVDTNMTPRAWVQALKDAGHITPADRVLICGVAPGECSAWVDHAVVAWLQVHLGSDVISGWKTS